MMSAKPGGHVSRKTVLEDGKRRLRSLLAWDEAALTCVCICGKDIPSFYCCLASVSFI